ncbi:MAG: septum formation initiator family protein [candidate division WOR-3 bacterium]
MARKSGVKGVIRWLTILGGLLLLYYLGTTLYSLIRVKVERAAVERELLHARARTLALEARREALKDPSIIKMIAERRLGMRYENPVNLWDSLRADSAGETGQ